METTITLNEQQVDYLKDQLEEIADNYKGLYSQKFVAIAQTILTKLEEAQQ
jgi:hypothetical protein